MKEITPLSSNEEINAAREQNSNQQTNALPAEQAKVAIPVTPPLTQNQPLDSQATIPVQTSTQTQANSAEQVTQQPQNPTVAHNPQSIYPEPLSFDDKQSREEAKIKYQGTPVSIFIVSLLAGVASLYGLITLLRIYFFSTAITFSLFTGPDSIFGSWAWVTFFIGIIQYALLLYASYKVWRGSKLALGFVTGVAFLYAYELVTSLYLISFVFSNNASITDLGFDYTARLVLYVVFFVSLLITWKKDLRFFT